MADELFGPPAEWVTQTRVEEALGRALNEEEVERLPQVVGGAQQQVIAAIGYAPYPVQAVVLRLRGVWSHRMQLPRRPVRQIFEVLVNGRRPPGWEWDPETPWDWGLRWRNWRTAPPDELIGPWPGYWGGTDATVQVDYEYGFDTLPEDLEVLVADLAALALVTAPEARAGMVRSQSLGPYRISYGNPWLQAGATFGGADAIVRRYGPPRNYSLPVTS